MPESRTPAKVLYRYLDVNGNGTGSIEATGDYSSAATDFYIQPPANTTYFINRMLVAVRDTGAFDAADYANGVALTNGISVSVTDSSDTEIVDLTDGQPIKTNAGWGALCYDVDVKTWGTGDEVLLVRWTFAAAGFAIQLNNRYKFKVVCNDNMTGLNSHTFHVQGWTT